MIDLSAIVSTLCSFPARAACSDAERRAAVWLHDDLRERGHEAWVETLWVRPQWALSLALHAALGVVASVAATAWPIPAAALAAIVLVSYLLELAGRGGLLTRLFYRRATQVVVVAPPDPDAITLLITAATDAPRRGLLFRPAVRRAAAALQRPLRGHAPGAAAWILIALAVVGAAAGARIAGAEGAGVGAVQFVPTVLLLLATAAALDIALSPVSPGASDAAGVAVAVALHQELTEVAPERLSAGLVLAGAGEAFPLGFQSHLRRERPDRARTVVLEVGPVQAGVAATRRTGLLVGFSVHPQLRVAADAAGLEPLSGHRASAAVAAQRRRIPAIAVRDAFPPAWRTAADLPGAVTPEALAAALQACVSLVDALDAELVARDE